MEQIRVHGIGGLAIELLLVDRNLVQLAKTHQRLPRIEVPFPPGGDNLDLRVQGIGVELKPHLIITLARGAVGDGIGPRRSRDFHQSTGNEGPRNGGAKQVLALIERIRSEHGKDVVAHEIFTQIFDEDLLCAEIFCLLPRRLDLLALAVIRREGHDLAAVFRLQPFQDDRSIEAPGVGQHDFFNHVALLEAGGAGDRGPRSP